MNNFLFKMEKKRILFLFFFIITGLIVMGQAQVASSASKPSVSASWNPKKVLLTITGKKWGKNQTVSVTDANNSSLLGLVKSNKSESWTLTLRNPASVPCTVRAESGSNAVESSVKKAPATCSSDSFTAVFAFNNLGMHCYDKDFSVFAILPPFNVVNAQVVRKGVTGSLPHLLDNTQASVSYSAVADSTGSINTTSVNKTNFWMYSNSLFGVSLPDDTGLLGQKMPGTGNVQQAFSAFNPTKKWFTAEGIPITDRDDKGQLNTYPLMKIQAVDIATTSSLKPISVVLPASDEMHCSNCHGSGGAAANDATKTRYSISGWSTSTDAELQYRENILILHDAKRLTNLMVNKPVLCASCHYSPALDLSNSGAQGKQLGKPLLSLAIHSRHGKTLAENIPDKNNLPVIPETGISTCYNCHPGSVTQCLRGVMGNAGIICQDCHGGLLAVGGVYAARTPWVNEPKCQSCHTGDAVSHLGSNIRGTSTYNPADQSATPIVAINKRFAEEDNTLFRNSRGHNGIACEACHGSTHAEWPVGNPAANDNVTSVQLQGHSGPIIECKTCHAGGPPLSIDGPHGLHNINDRSWNGNHDNFFRQNASLCKACHGVLLEGTVLSRAAADRTLFGDDNRSVSVPKGTQISCTLCHENPLKGGG